MWYLILGNISLPVVTACVTRHNKCPMKFTYWNSASNMNSNITIYIRIGIEKYIKGTEVSCGVLGNEKPEALPVIEIIPKTEFFDYQAKYDETQRDEIVPARISKRLTKKVQELAIKVFQAIECRGFGRVDMIIYRGKPYILEINTIPGLTPVSLFPKEAAAAGLSYSQLLDKIIELALEK